ncbi:hypothetical protein FQA39_LY17901 [Lamprigera yunnana]|nr:hypothetical protein FQA39_LY17901 [Lamprigera yunnana]
MSQDSPVLGIDLGTTSCCVGYLAANNHDVDIIENQQGDRTTPSYVAFTDEDEVIGKLAKDRVFRNQKNVVYDSKRFIGRQFDDEYLQRHLKKWTFSVVSGKDKTPLIQIFKDDEITTYKPQEISAKLLSYMKMIAEKRLSKTISDVIITVPAYFNYHQRIATTEAGELAGLNVLKIINEPSAAALAYVHKNDINDCNNILVFDLGGGTFDVSIVKVCNKDIEVKAISGNTFLGGRDFDDNLANLIVKKIKDKYDRDVRDLPSSMRRINARSEKVKTELSFETKTNLDLHNILQDGEDINFEITRKEFETVNDRLFTLCLQTVQNCLNDAKINKNDIEKVLLIGGSTRIPKIRQLLVEYFGSKSKLTQAINPDEAVAYGAAIQASAIRKSGDTKEGGGYKITEVTPLSLGTDTIGDRMSIIIARNTPIPVTKTKKYMTISDKQKEMDVNVFEGERSLIKYNTKIGTCTITLPPKPPGYSVEVCFHIDENGILRVGAMTNVGIYTNLAIKYEKHTKQGSDDVLRVALENKERDDKESEVISLWVKLKEYCIKTKSLCTYKSEIFSDEDKMIISNITTTISEWVTNNKVVSGNDEEKNAILDKKVEMECICEPILNKYGWTINNMCISDFYKLINP